MRMRVGFITYFFPKLTETFVLNKILELQRLGVDVLVFACKDGRTTSTVEGAADLNDTFGAEVEDIARRCIYVHDIRAVSLSYLEARYQLDVIHVEWGYLAEMLLEQGACKAPLFVTFHEVVPSSAWSLDFDEGYRRVTTHAHQLMPVSKHLASRLINLGADESRTVVRHCGVDLSKCKRHSPKPTGDVIRILCNGSFIPKKGHEYAILAFAQLSFGLRGRCQLRIVGDGPLKQHLRQIVNSYGLTEQVHFCGKLSHQDALAEVGRADIFVAPSVTEDDGYEEGIPVVLMEAGACQVPMIGTSHAGIPEIIEDEKTGLIVPEKDVVSLRRAITRIACNPELGSRLGGAAYRKVCDEFNLQKATEQLLGAYESALVDQKPQLENANGECRVVNRSGL